MIFPLKYLYRIEKLLKLINDENTGSPGNFANSLGISRRQLYNILEELKIMGVPIEYSRSRKTFYLQSEYIIKINVSMKW